MDPHQLRSRLDTLSGIPQLASGVAHGDEQAAPDANWLRQLVDRWRLFKWIRRDLFNFLEEQGPRARAAARAFWHALPPEDREALHQLLADIRTNRLEALRNRDQDELLRLAASLQRGLDAAIEAWDSYEPRPPKAAAA